MPARIAEVATDSCPFCAGSAQWYARASADGNSEAKRRSLHRHHRLRLPRVEGIGPDLWELGAVSTRASVGREPVIAEDCGSGVSSWARTPTGF